jgi:pantoate--beta-alanine ligase
VLTILNKFFNIINPNILILGKKDYQQFILVKDFIKDKNLNIKTIGVETIRERNGLGLFL